MKKLLTRNRTGYTFMIAIHTDRLHSASPRFSVNPGIKLSFGFFFDGFGALARRPVRETETQVVLIRNLLNY